MAIRVAINGFGRIGRMVFRIMADDPRFEVVGLNDLASPADLAHLLKYDTVAGRFGHRVEVSGDGFLIDGKALKVHAVRDPAELPWAAEKVDFVVESTGIFRTREACEKHLQAGAKKVLLTVPAKDEIDATVVMGVNEEVLTADHAIISNASCTTNCLAPVAKVLNDSFGIERGLMTTVHAYTNDQRTADMIHKDLRRARAAAANIIPTSTGAARAVGKVIPELNGKLDGCAMRVPVVNGSVVDLTVLLGKAVSRDEVNAAMKAAADGPMKGILGYTEDPIVSSDVLGQPESSLFDGLSTMASDRLVKVVSWYDNEWGYSNRVCDLIALSHGL
ncbi:MAG: type I glyceraldehyde-3-phosphate dehydrogenase [Planctomycetota bacterium JB042]